MTDAHGTDGLTFPPGKLEYSRTLVFCPRLEDGVGATDVGAGPVGKGGVWGGRWDSDILQRVVERLGWERREARHVRGGDAFSGCEGEGGYIPD